MTPTEAGPPTEHGAFDGWLARMSGARQALLAVLIRRLLDDAIDLLGGLF